MGLVLWRRMIFGNNRNSAYTKCIIYLISEQEKNRDGDRQTLIKDAINLFGEMGLHPVELIEQEIKKDNAMFAGTNSIDIDMDDDDKDGKETAKNGNNDDDDDDDDDDANNAEIFAQEGFVKDKVDKTLLFYEKYFLREFRRSTERMCLKEMDEMIGKIPMIEFTKNVKRRIDYERETCRSVLFPSSFDKVYPAILRVLVETRVLDYCSELRSILEEYEGEAAVKDGVDITTRVGDLRVVYDVLSMTKHGLLMAQSVYAAFLEKTGKKKVEALLATGKTAADLPVRFSKLIITMWNNYSEIVSEKFLGNAEVKKSQKDAFRNFVNASYNGLSFNAGEAFAKFLDSVLKKASKSSQTAASSGNVSTEAIISALSEVFPLVDDKDVFFALYARSLSKRLITGTSVSKELEQRFINEVITSDNREYFLKFNGMFEDLEGSAQLTADFRASAEWEKARTQNALPTPVIQLLSSSFWSLPQLSIELRLPEKIAVAEAVFEEYYTTKNKSKKLVWAHNFAKADISTSFFGSAGTPALAGGYVITAPIMQIAVLDLFNGADSLTYAQISEKTQLFGQNLDSAIYPFLILHMLTATAPAGNAGVERGCFFAPATVFTLNKSFVGKKAKIGLGLINPSTSAGAAKFLNERSPSSSSSSSSSPVPESPASGSSGGSDDRDQESMDIDKFVVKQRLEMTKACIVRVMKAGKEVSHSDLFTKVSSELQCRFKLTAPVFKKALDYLLDEEYVARSKKEKDLYIYT